MVGGDARRKGKQNLVDKKAEISTYATEAYKECSHGHLWLENLMMYTSICKHHSQKPTHVMTFVIKDAMRGMIQSLQHHISIYALSNLIHLNTCFWSTSHSSHSYKGSSIKEPLPRQEGAQAPNASSSGPKLPGSSWVPWNQGSPWAKQARPLVWVCWRQKQKKIS